MEQIDEHQSDIKTEPVTTAGAPSSFQLNEDLCITICEKEDSENEKKQRKESNSQDCVDNVVRDDSSIKEFNDSHIADVVKSYNDKAEEEDLNNVTNKINEDATGKSIQMDNKEYIKDEECKGNEKTESLSTDGDMKCVKDISTDKENAKCLHNAETSVKDKDENIIEERNVCSVSNANTFDDNDHQCHELIKTLGETFQDKNQTLHHADTGTNTDLSKLVDNNSQVMVLTVETVPVNNLDEITEENIVLTVHEKSEEISFSDGESLKEKSMKNTDIENGEFNLIDYAHENEDTIIEVISTEIVHLENSEVYTEEGNRDFLNHKAVKTSSVHTLGTNNAEQLADNDMKPIKIETQNKDVTTGSGQTYDKSKTEIDDKVCKNNIKEDTTRKLITATCKGNQQEDNGTSRKTNETDVPKKRSVIQDIFDDWVDENVDDDNQAENKEQDTVEVELKSLLNDTKTQAIDEDTIVVVAEEITCIKREPDKNVDRMKEDVAKNKESLLSEEGTHKNETTKNQPSQNSITLPLKDQINASVVQGLGKSLKDMINDTAIVSQTSSSQIQTHSIVNRARNITSHIASPAEVTKALKERLREKQKIVDAPLRPDIFFVKKLTQRLSSKLAGSPASSLPALLPLAQSANQPTTQSDKTSADNTESNKESSSEDKESNVNNKVSNCDNKELLAILEGDVDPDWSNLKPPILIEEGKYPVKMEQSNYNTPPKLDPLVEKEIALKQLLELPVIEPVKKNNSKKKKSLITAQKKSLKEGKESSASNAEPEIIQIEQSDESTVSKKPAEASDSCTSPTITETHTPDANVQDVRLDESRSGRKRKLTEKAREHEQQQSIVKRHKIYKNKFQTNRKQSTQKTEIIADTDLVAEKDESKEGDVSINDDDDKATDNSLTTALPEKQVANNNKMEPSINEFRSTPLKHPKQSLSKRKSQTISKKNVVVKKMLKQSIPSTKKGAVLKAKLSSKKSTSKVVPKTKRSNENSTGDSKPKKKIINEIDRLLQDEGVVNLLYDVEQPNKKRLIPVTKSQTKVMDLQKVHRELRLRKKLVRNAVLRLRTSTANVSKVSSRSKRAGTCLNDIETDKKIGDQPAPMKQQNLTSDEFIVPAKIRNAADASVIIRRHSSSSFSSASGSPRVSVDAPEKAEGLKADESATHTLRSTKRRLSQEERGTMKKSKKKIVQKADVVSAITPVESKVVQSVRFKKTDLKKAEKNSKQPDMEEVNSEVCKVITRSSGTATEAASALSIVNAGNRTINAGASRKNKANAGVTKTVDLNNEKTKIETRSQFSNKEINVRRHGNLVQLILMPSSSTKIQNALTLQVMQEFRETLSILKKDDDCRVVLLTSTGSSFCEGLELSMLLHTNKEERRIHAEEVADTVKDFIKSLASFNKPIVAGVQGATIGLGVTMLPLFDLVIASDKATFCTPYGKLGQIAEGAAVFTLSHILGSAITSELLLGGRTLTANEALRAGLVTRVLWPDRFQVELLPTLKAMSEQSSQSMEATKALLRHSLRRKLDAALESETYLLIQHWCSAECQTAIKAYIDGKIQ